MPNGPRLWIFSFYENWNIISKSMFVKTLCNITYVGDYFTVQDIKSQHWLHLKLVINIWKLSPTQPVFNIRHQHQWNSNEFNLL